MTKNEFGLMLRREWPELAEIGWSDERIAEYVLNTYPQFYDAISPTARRVKEITQRPIESNRWTEKGRLESAEYQIKNQRAEIDMVHRGDVVMRASEAGVSVEVFDQLQLKKADLLAAIKLEEHKVDQQIRLEREKVRLKAEEAKDQRDIGLDGHDRYVYPEFRAKQLEQELFDLIDRRDKETHADKKEILETRIKHLRETLNGLGTVVPDDDRKEAESDNQDSDHGQRSPASSETGQEQTSPPRNRVGFRPDGRPD